MSRLIDVGKGTNPNPLRCPHFAHSISKVTSLYSVVNFELTVGRNTVGFQFNLQPIESLFPCQLLFSIAKLALRFCPYPFEFALAVIRDICLSIFHAIERDFNPFYFISLAFNLCIQDYDYVCIYK